MANIYIPDQYINNCNVIYPSFIRSYLDNSYTDYVDIFFKSDYYLQRGTDTSGITPLCDNLNSFTTDVWYRYDISHILIIFLILTIFVVYLPYKIYSRVFGRWLKW